MSSYLGLCASHRCIGLVCYIRLSGSRQQHSGCKHGLRVFDPLQSLASATQRVTHPYRLPHTMSSVPQAHK